MWGTDARNASGVESTSLSTARPAEPAAGAIVITHRLRCVSHDDRGSYTDNAKDAIV
jgi:hypothetical protein